MNETTNIMKLFRGTTADIIKREVERLNKEFLSYNCDSDYQPASVAFKCVCKTCSKIAEFIILSVPIKNPIKCYIAYIFMDEYCNDHMNQCIDISLRDKYIDLDDLHTMIDNIGKKLTLIRIKLRQPYYCPKDCFVTMGDSYYW